MPKYKSFGQVIPQDSRQELNNKILFLIDNERAEASGITREDIYNAYTGDGGLHGLKYSDYDNYSDYSSAKKEIENGQYFTPHHVCKFIMECLQLDKSEIVADLTCGMGNFINFSPQESNFYGCEVDVKAYKVAKYLYPKANLTCGDIRSYDVGIKLDYVVGNPPFHLQWWVDGEKILSQLYYCQKAAELLKPYGIMVLVVPCSFLADDFSDSGMIREMEKSFSFLGQIELKPDTFSGVGVTEYRTKVQFWQRNSSDTSWEPKKYSTQMLEIQPGTEGIQQVRTMILDAPQALFRNNRPSILLELARDRDSSSDFLYQTRKYLFAIKSHPALQDHYARCCEYISRYYTQRQPADMSYEEWSKIRLTEAKVLAYLRRTVRLQQKKPYRDEIRMVKHDGIIGYKAYSPGMSRELKSRNMQEAPIYEIVSDGRDLGPYGPYARMLRRRRREYEIEQRPFKDMQENSVISAWLDAFKLFDSENEEIIFLNDRQKHDINLFLQKRYVLLQWEQGSGKTLAGIAASQYRMEKENAYCSWVVSSAISIKNNWDVVLPNYGIHYVLVNRLRDLDKIQKGDLVLITMKMLSKYRKQIKKWVHKHKRISLVLDESDEITNPSSIRCKAVLDVFRRVRWKLLMTGTSTRNNISEFAPQLELAYNNSVNMISWVPMIYTYDRKNVGMDGKPLLTDIENPYYGKPIPAYRPGYNLFSQSHLPEKITVFGVGQRTQDIFNSEYLSDILSRFVITRSFEEISGKDIKRIHQVTVHFSEAERAVYQQAVSEFHTMQSHYFASTGNTRKDAMMRLIQQITLMLRIAAAPNTLTEYQGGTPVKIAKVLSMLEENDDRIVAIGVRHKIVVDAYAEAIRQRMPDRPLFIVTGSTTSLAKRRALRKTLRDSGNGILLCTQQSLPSSVNFEYVDDIIIPELHYNNSQMSQFYFRFIRYTSEREKNIYFVTYVGSIESNQMQMVLAKERINLFMRGKDTDLDEIYARFGVDYDLLSLLMYREVDEDGNFQIRWGEQTIMPT